MSKPVKIFEIKGDSWMKGLSRQTYSMIGGLFKTAANFDPFDRGGILIPSHAVTATTGTTSTANFLTPFSAGGVGYVYAHGPTKLYEIVASTQVGTDVTSDITAGAVSGTDVWRGRYIYVLDTEAKSIVLHAGNNASLLTGLTSGVPHIATTGPDLNEYITNGNDLAKLILESGTTGNTTTTGIGFETGQVTKDLDSDGRYLVIISDNNTTSATSGRSKCVVTYWDCLKPAADAIYEIDDLLLIAVKVIGGVTHILGYNGIWVCNVSSPPKMVVSFLGTSPLAGVNRPSGPNMVTVRQGVLYWAPVVGTQIWAYGNPLDPTKKIIFQPYNGVGTGNNLAIANSGSLIWASNSGSLIHVLNTGSTRGLVNMIVAPLDFDGRFSFGYLKVVLNTKLASGESVTLKVLNQDGLGVVSNEEVKSYSTDPDRQTLLFYKKPIGTSDDVLDFEEISALQIQTTKVSIKRIELWGTPLEPQYQL